MSFGGGAVGEAVEQAEAQDDFSIMGQCNFATGPATVFSSDFFGDEHCKCANCHKNRFLLFKIMLHVNPGVDQGTLTFQLKEFTGHEVHNEILMYGPIARMIAQDEAIAQAEQAMMDAAIEASSEISAKKKTPLPQEIIEKLGKVKLTSKHVEDKITCSVCTMPVTEEEIGTEIFHLECGDKFHQECLLPWITAEADFCPNCRIKIVAPSDGGGGGGGGAGGGGGGGGEMEK